MGHKYYDMKKYGYDDVKVRADRTKYRQNNSLAVALLTEDGSVFGIITVNINATDLLTLKARADGYAYVDLNNFPWLTEFLEETGIAKATGESSISGFCDYPLYQFDLKQIPWEDGVGVDSSCTVMIETAVFNAKGNTTSETHHTIECDCESCLMNPHGVCLAPLFTSRFPNWDTPDGCTDFVMKEGTP